MNSILSKNSFIEMKRSVITQELGSIWEGEGKGESVGQGRRGEGEGNLNGADCIFFSLKLHITLNVQQNLIQ